MSGLLNESQTKFFEVDITCMDIADVQEGRQRSKFLVVGFSDNTVRVLSLEPESCLHRISMQVVLSVPESVSLINLKSDRS